MATRDSKKVLSCALDVGGDTMPLSPLTCVEERGVALGAENGVSTSSDMLCWLADGAVVPIVCRTGAPGSSVPPPVEDDGTAVTDGLEAPLTTVGVAVVTAPLEEPADDLRYSPIEPLEALLWGNSLLLSHLAYCAKPVAVRFRPGVK